MTDQANMRDRPPVFEVIVGDHSYRIWQDGQIDGFGDEVIVVNRIPPLIELAQACAGTDTDVVEQSVLPL